MSNPSIHVRDPACYRNEGLVEKVDTSMDVCDDQAMRRRDYSGDFRGTLTFRSQQESDKLKPWGREHP